MPPSLPVSRSERRALADLLEQLGPDQPTCCAGWTTRDLATHLVVRDRRPDAMPGLALGGPFAWWTQRVQARAGSARPFGVLVSQLRSGPPGWLPSGWPPLERLLNTAEYVIHHEDVRRAQPDWSPRDLPRSVHDQLWSALPVLARGRSATRPPGGIVVRRSDVPDGAPGSERRLRKGEPTTTVTGTPLEIVLWLSGRPVIACVDLSVE